MGGPDQCARSGAILDHQRLAETLLQPLTEQAACVVVAPTALEAEVLSTACLSMGKRRARDYTREELRAGVHVAPL